jgi:hypothetical protein
MVTDLEILPVSPEAVNVYVVVEAGVTVIDPAGLAVPTPGSIVTELAPVTFHTMVVDCPEVITRGFASKTTTLGTHAVPASTNNTNRTAIAIFFINFLPYLFVSVDR